MNNIKHEICKFLYKFLSIRFVTLVDIEVTIIIPVSIFQTKSLKFLLDNKNILDYKQFRMQLRNEGNFTEN